MVDVAANSPEHGTRARYRAGCGCAPCKKWKADDQAAYRERKRLREAGDTAAPEPKRAASRARPTAPKRPTAAVIIDAGDHDSEGKLRAALTVRRPSHDDPLAQMIDDALFEARGDESTAAVIAAEAIRNAGWRPLQGAVERALRRALGDPGDDDMRAMRHEIVLRGARVLDDPESGRNYKSTVEAMRQVLADLGGDDGGAGGGGFAGIVEAIREAGRDRNDPEVVDPA